MKTNHFARQIVRIRFSLSLVALVAILGAELGLGASMAFRMGRTSSAQSPTQPESLNVSVGDMVAMGR